MIIKNHMSKNVITVEKSSSINKAMDLMSEHDLHRLPVVENGKMVGLLTKGMISKKGASQATSLSIFELNYLLSKTDVATIMEKKVHTINENQYLEDAAVEMVKYDIGCLPVMNDANELVGILTQNDLFKSFITMLGYDAKGSRLCLRMEDTVGALEKVSKIIGEYDMNISHIGVYGETEGCKDLVIRVDSNETAELVKKLEENGFQVLSAMSNPQ